MIRIPERVHRPLALLGVVALAIGVYANSFPNGFALDDEPIVLENANVHGVEKLQAAVDSPYWPRRTLVGQVYRPVTMVTYAVNWEAAGAQPMPYHVVNVALHGAVTACVFSLIGALGAPLAGAAAGAAVFAVHPVHVEAVANVVGRAELLCALFFLLACLVYLRRGWAPYVRLPLLALLYLLAMGAKEMGMTLPAALVLLEALRWPRLRELPRRLLGEAPAFFLLAATAAAFLVVRQSVLGAAIGDLAAPELRALSTGERLLAAVRVWPEYARLMLFPRRLAADYAPGVMVPPTSFDATIAFSLLVGAAAVVVGVRAWRGAPLLAVGVFWFIITIVPASNLVVPIGILLAERTLYLPSVGVAMAVAAIPALLPDQRRARVLAVAVLLVALALGAARTWQRNPTWRSSETVLRTLLRDHPESFRTLWALAGTYQRNGNVERALAAYRAAVDAAPHHYNLRLDYARALFRAGRYPQAATAAAEASRLVPHYGDPYLLQSNALLYQGKQDSAIVVLAEGLARATSSVPSLYDNLAAAYGERGSWPAALRARTVSLALHGDSASPRQWRDLARILEKLGRREEAATALERARAPAGRRPSR